MTKYLISVGVFPVKNIRARQREVYWALLWWTTALKLFNFFSAAQQKTIQWQIYVTTLIRFSLPPCPQWEISSVTDLWVCPLKYFKCLPLGVRFVTTSALWAPLTVFEKKCNRAWIDCKPLMDVYDVVNQMLAVIHHVHRGSGWEILLYGNVPRYDNSTF